MFDTNKKLLSNLKPESLNVPIHSFYKSEPYLEVSNSLFEYAFMKHDPIMVKNLNTFQIKFTIENDKIKIITKDLILMFVWYYYYKVTENTNNSIKIIKQLNSHYFEGDNKGDFVFLCFNIANILVNRYECNVYIVDSIARISTINQYTIGEQNKVWWNDWMIILNFSKIIFNIFRWTKMPYLDSHLILLSDKEKKLIKEIRTPQYDLDNMKIKFDNEGMKEIFMDGKEYELSRYHELEENIKHWEIWKKKYNWKTQYITIKNQVVKLDKKSWNQ